jgi:hypothetical protein
MVAMALHAPGHGTRCEGRRLEDSGRALGKGRTDTTKASDGASIGVSPTESAESRRDERDPFRAAHGLSVERAEWHRDLLELFGPSAIPRVDRGGSVREGVGPRSA